MRSFLVLFFKILILFYRIGVSPYIGRNCRFSPTCSQYALIVIERHGPFLGFYLTIKRLLRCHPFNKGGIDLPP